MALHINFLHEQLAQKKQAERDPLKIGILAMMGVGMLLAGWYFYKQASSASVLAENRAAVQAYAKLEPEVKKYEKDKMELETKIALSDSVVGRIEGRFFWAPALETILKALPPTAQLNALGGTSPASTSGTIRLEGIIGGTEPLAEADKVRKQLIAELEKSYKNVKADFTTLKDSPAPVKYKGIEYPAASFEISIKLDAMYTPPPVKPPSPPVKAAAKPVTNPKP